MAMTIEQLTMLENLLATRTRFTTWASIADKVRISTATAMRYGQARKKDPNYILNRIEAAKKPRPLPQRRKPQPKAVPPPEKKTFKKPQLCWNCQKACGGCNWSDKLKPVEGWMQHQQLSTQCVEYT